MEEAASWWALGGSMCLAVLLSVLALRRTQRAEQRAKKPLTISLSDDDNMSVFPAVPPATPRSTSRFLDKAVAGVEFLKFGRWGRPKKRLVTYHLDEHALSFGDKCIRLSEVTSVENTSKVLRRNQSKYPERCFSIVTQSRTLDLEASSLAQKREWEAGLKALLAKAALPSSDASPENRARVYTFRAKVSAKLKGWEARSCLARELIASDRLLEKFLIARDFDYARTEEMLFATLSWREQEAIDSLLDDPQPIFLKIRTHSSNRYQLEHKHTKSGQPLHIERCSKLDVDFMCDCELSDLVKSKIHLMEFKHRMMLNGSDQSTNIFDLKGFSSSMLRPKIYKYINSLATVTQAYYPETLGQLFVVRAPTLFPMVWRGIKPWLDARTQNKFSIHSDLGTDELLKKIPAENLPAELGGTCQCTGKGCDEQSWMDVMYQDVCELGWPKMAAKWKEKLQNGSLIDPDPQLREVLQTSYFK